MSADEIKLKDSSRSHVPQNSLMSGALKTITGSGTLFAEITPVETLEADLTREVRRLVEEFRATFGHNWWNFIDTRVVGIVIILRFLCYTVNHNVIGPAYYVAFANLASPEAFKASGLERLKELVAHLQGTSSQGTIPP